MMILEDPLEIQPFAVVPATPVGTRPATSDEPEWQRLSDTKVMIVDGEDLNIEVLRTFLEDAGYNNVFSATESGAAMEMLANERPDVVLLDLVLPGASGIAILSWMRADSTLKHTPVIILAAAADPDAKLEALELGATDFLAKPVDASELALRLRNTLVAKAYRDRLAHSDFLTGLPNRERYMDRLDWALRHGKRYGTRGAVLQIGLDRFRHINDALGPGLGDRLLMAVATRLKECVRESDYVARVCDDVSQAVLSRLASDEFTVLLPDITGVDGVAVVAQRILDLIAAPFHIAGRELFVTCCIGIAVFPDDGTGKDAILKGAGVAMHHAKRQRRGSYQFYSRDLNAKSLYKLSLEGELRKALERDELQLHYQPQIDLKTGRLVGTEALVRWQHPERGMVMPGDFIALAEQTGLIVPLGEWVLRAACEQIGAWHAAGLMAARVSVNVSSHQFRQRQLAQTVRNVLDRTGVDARYLALELTESAIMDSAEESIGVLRGLKDIGIMLSIDDFGTGYSSLSYLKRFPIDELKIDHSFIAEIETDQDNAAIIVAITAMGHSLGLEVAAEGVETEAQLRFLRALGCDLCQGYLFSRAVSPEAITALLRPGMLPVIPVHKPADGA